MYEVFVVAAIVHSKWQSLGIGAAYQVQIHKYPSNSSWVTFRASDQERDAEAEQVDASVWEARSEIKTVLFLGSSSETKPSIGAVLDVGTWRDNFHATPRNERQRRQRRVKPQTRSSIEVCDISLQISSHCVIVTTLKLFIATRVCCTVESIDVVLVRELQRPNRHMILQFELALPYLESPFRTPFTRQQP
ncbi:hypothetical protein P153DRAFT_394633 [Dothidotthia symphoricarpi CBS 119687]|uniref:Uncharacterized protein n=1 Tax=Dothidotthia symphoricarpi CBS 119687 TaxID=1392245 RepID=A0A6A6AHJ2_9PLEO|nr:uncharacterized protein P153DRAFT_394633 [Dothidotthia symphoricarpi CBS 119687]KAF2131280.1 hypothetical protein P153DRAFT_394633 [Dothidotthia symphoricarpi CBS 119687]